MLKEDRRCVGESLLLVEACLLVSQRGGCHVASRIRVSTCRVKDRNSAEAFMEPVPSGLRLSASSETNRMDYWYIKTPREWNQAG